MFLVYNKTHSWAHSPIYTKIEDAEDRAQDEMHKHPNSEVQILPVGDPALVIKLFN